MPTSGPVGFEARYYFASSGSLPGNGMTLCSCFAILAYFRDGALDNADRSSMALAVILFWLIYYAIFDIAVKLVRVFRKMK